MLEVNLIPQFGVHLIVHIYGPRQEVVVASVPDVCAGCVCVVTLWDALGPRPEVVGAL